MKDPRFARLAGRGSDGRWYAVYPCRMGADSEEELFLRWSVVVQEIESVLNRPASYEELRAGGVPHPDTRTEGERRLTAEKRKLELNPPPAEKSEKTILREHLQAKLEQERFAKLSPTEQLFQNALAAEREEFEQKSQEAARIAARKPFEKLLSDAQLRMIAARYDSQLTAEEVEEIEHQFNLFNKNLDADTYKLAKRETDAAIAARLAQSEMEAELLFLQLQKQRSRFLPPAEETPPQVQTWTRPPEPAESTMRGRKLTRFFLPDGRTVVLSDALIGADWGDIDAIVSKADDWGSVDDAVRIETDIPTKVK